MDLGAVAAAQLCTDYQGHASDGTYHWIQYRRAAGQRQPSAFFASIPVYFTALIITKKCLSGRIFMLIGGGVGQLSLVCNGRGQS